MATSPGHITSGGLIEVFRDLATPKSRKGRKKPVWTKMNKAGPESTRIDRNLNIFPVPPQAPHSSRRCINDDRDDSENTQTWDDNLITTWDNHPENQPISSLIGIMSTYFHIFPRIIPIGFGYGEPPRLQVPVACKKK
jgi:hypothetical protein